MRRILEDEQIYQRERIAYIHGRIERELEAFADSLNVPAVELTARVGALLLGIRPGYDDSLSDLSGSRNHLEAGSGSSPSPTLESLIESHGSRAQLPASSSAGETPQSEVKRTNKKNAKGYWEKMTPEQRTREMKRRRSLWSKAALKKWRGEIPRDVVKKRPAKKTVPLVETAA